MINPKSPAQTSIYLEVLTSTPDVLPDLKRDVQYLVNKYDCKSLKYIVICLLNKII